MCRYTCSIMFHVDCSENESQIEADLCLLIERREETEKRNAFYSSYSLMLGKKSFLSATHVCGTEKRSRNSNRNKMTIAPRSPPRSVLVVATPVDMCTHACTTCCTASTTLRVWRLPLSAYL